MEKIDFGYLEETMKSCPLCGGDTFTPLVNNDRYFMGLKTVGCSRCGLIQSNPRPSEKGLNLFYERDYRKFYQGVSEPNEKYIYEMNKKERLKESALYLRQLDMTNADMTILDIGCSEGAFFNALRSAGFLGDFYGIEPNPEFRVYAKNTTGATVLDKLDNMTKKADLITLNHVFEHLDQPNEYLLSLRNIMNDAACLYIDVPNANEYGTIDDIHIAHMFHYTVRTLSLLVENAGFIVKICEEYSPISHPKSIRLVALKNSDISGDKKVPDISEEMKAWDKVRKLSVYKKKLVVFARRIPFMRQIYRAIFK